MVVKKKRFGWLLWWSRGQFWLVIRVVEERKFWVVIMMVKRDSFVYVIA